MKNSAKILLFLIPLIFLPSCEEASFQKEMVRFDQAFIPVLYYVHQDKLILAERALYRLDNQWDLFDEKYKNKLETNEDWKEAFRQADAWLNDARISIRHNDQANALVQMDHLRYELVEARRIKGMPYYLDQVWDMENALMAVVEVADDQMLGLLDFEDFKCLTNDLNHEWSSVLKAPLDEYLFDLYPKKIEAFRNRQWQMTSSLAYFSEAVECGDGEQFGFQAQKLKNDYLEFIAVFGNFNAPEDHFFARMQ